MNVYGSSSLWGCSGHLPSPPSLNYAWLVLKSLSQWGLLGHEIAPNTAANATKIIVLATKIQKLVAKLWPELFGFLISYLDVFYN